MQTRTCTHLDFVFGAPTARPDESDSLLVCGEDCFEEEKGFVVAGGAGGRALAMSVENQMSPLNEHDFSYILLLCRDFEICIASV